MSEPSPIRTRKSRLARECLHTARKLIAHDRIDAGAEVLATYQQRFGDNPDGFLRHGLAVLLVLFLLRNCEQHQARHVSYLLDEHLSCCGSENNRRALRRAELEMYQRIGDLEGVAKCLRLLSEGEPDR